MDIMDVFPLHLNSTTPVTHPRKTRPHEPFSFIFVRIQGHLGEVSNIPGPWRYIFWTTHSWNTLCFSQKKRKGKCFGLFLKLDFHLVNSRNTLRVYFGHFISGNILVETPRNKIRKIHPNVGSPHSAMAQHPLPMRNDAGFRDGQKRKNQLAKCIKDWLFHCPIMLVQNHKPLSMPTI